MKLLMKLLNRFRRWLHCLWNWHEPRDGTMFLWCATCGKKFGET